MLVSFNAAWDRTKDNVRDSSRSPTSALRTRRSTLQQREMFEPLVRTEQTVVV